MPIYQLDGKSPKISKTSYVHPQAVIIGNVEIGSHCFVGPGAVLRGDFGRIKIGEKTIIQENCILHVGVNETTSIHDHVIITHGAVVHDVTLKPYVVVGMGAILMHGVFVEDHVLIGAGSLVKEGVHIRSRTVVAGSPARIIKPLSNEQKKGIHRGVKLYQDLLKRYLKTCREVARRP
jgi:carbonic anhydrase/acetyltransferase-like protein (isoleucine patch superfamily)